MSGIRWPSISCSRGPCTFPAATDAFPPPSSCCRQGWRRGLWVESLDREQLRAAVVVRHDLLDLRDHVALLLRDVLLLRGIRLEIVELDRREPLGQVAADALPAAHPHGLLAAAEQDQGRNRL